MATWQQREQPGKGRPGGVLKLECCDALAKLAKIQRGRMEEEPPGDAKGILPAD